MSERTMGPGGDRPGHGGAANAPSAPNGQDRPDGHGRPGPLEAPALPATHLAPGRHEGGPLRGGGAPRDEETTDVNIPDGDHQGAPPPWQRLVEPQPANAAGPSAGHQGGSAEPAATTEVYRPAVGVAATTMPAAKHAASGHHGTGHGGPAEATRAQPYGPAPAGPANPGGARPQHFPPPGPGNGQRAGPIGGPGTDLRGHHDQGQAHQLPGRFTARPAAPVRGRVPRAPRKASLQIRRFDPWSVLKLSLVLSVAMFLIWLVAVGVLYGVLNGMGVWDKLNGAWNDLASVNEAGAESEPLISAGRVFSISAVVGAINIVLFTAFATVSAFIYNVSADLAGGVEVTLSERD